MKIKFESDKYNHQACDAQIAQFWAEAEVHKSTGAPCQKEVFSVDTPPPTVSGSLHVGHLFSYCHADFLVRYNRQMGKKVFYPMGFDDNGLPTEKFAVESKKVSMAELGRAEFVKVCHQVSREVGLQFRNFWTKLGLSVDWDLVYSTISDKTVRASQTAFLSLLEKDLVQRRAEPFLFCTSCRTSVAQAELEWKEKEGAIHTILFNVAQTGHPIKIATTRPELIEACVAVMVNPGDPRTAKLLGKTIAVPISGREVPVIADSAVDPDKGTGVVMCCTFGDQTDVAWFRIHSLPLIELIGQDGRMTSRSQFAGQRVAECRKNVLARLSQEGLLEKSDKIGHGASVHERCGSEVEFLVTNQWFVKIAENKELFLDLAGKIEWTPEHFKHRYDDWVANLSWDWCVSRQRFYGVAIPVFYCLDCSATVPAPVDSLPVWPADAKLSDVVCQKCGGANLRGETDVLDTWFTSSITPLLNAGWPDKDFSAPMALRPQAHDIIRTWAFYTIVHVYYQTGQLPWKQIAMSGHVLAAPGQKISKSKGNAKSSPEELLQDFGADALRYWAAGGRLGLDTIFDPNAIKRGLRTQTKLVNAVKFASGHAGLSEPTMPETGNSILADWLLSELAMVEEVYHQAFSAFDYTGARDALEGFFWATLCDNYLELSKDIFFNPDKYGKAAVEQNKAALSWTVCRTVAMYGPFMPFVVEWLAGLYTIVGQDKSIHSAEFVRTRVERLSLSQGAEIDLLISIVEFCRKTKSLRQVSQKTPMGRCLVFSASRLDRETQSLLCGLAGIAKLEWAGDLSELEVAEFKNFSESEPLKVSTPGVGLWF